jgi:hypothetical protein
MKISTRIMAGHSALFLTAFGLLSNSDSFAQGRNTARADAQDKQAAIKVFGANDPDFDKMTAPDKWKDQSAVVLCQKMNYSYLRDGKNIAVEELFRRRVLLQDKAAVEQFSTFYFVKASSNSIGIKIVKPNGKEEKVNTRDAVSSEVEVPSIFRTYYYTSDYKKLAIPNLEVGDIIDYFYSTTDSRPSLLSYAFPSFHFALSPEYPIFLQRFDFIVDRGFFINFNSYNGAPDIVEGPPGKDAAGRVRATIKTYFLEDVDREAVKDERWSYIRPQFPSVKFQVAYVAGAGTLSLLLGETSIAKKEATPEEICGLARKIMDNAAYRSSELAANTISYLRKNLPNEKDPLTVAQEAYGHLRYQFLENYYGTKEGEKDGRDDLVSIKDNVFALSMFKVLESRKIPARIVVLTRRSIGRVQDVLLGSEIDLAIQVDGQVIFAFNNMSHMNDLNPAYQGTEAYTFIYTPSGRGDIGVETITIPLHSAESNRVENVLKVSLNDDMTELLVDRQKTMAGASRFNYAIALRGSKYIQDERMEYDRRGAEASERGNKARLAEEQRRYESQLEELRARRDSALKEAMEDSYKIGEYKDFELVSPGRTREQTTMTFTDRYTIRELVNKAGANYMLEIGKLMGEQTSIEEDERNARQSRIDLAYPITVQSRIEVKVPSGYAVEGLDALTRSINNAAGSLNSSASVKDGVIIFEVTRVYAKATSPKEDWPSFVAIIDGAFDLSESKVILRKQR